MEENGSRWTKPFVGTLSLHAMFELRSCLLHGSLLLDTLANNAFGVVNVIVDDLVATKQLDVSNRDRVFFQPVGCCPLCLNVDFLYL